MWRAEWLLWVALLLPVAASAGERQEAAPEPELLEFIGSWDGGVEDASWLRMLDLGFWLSGEGRRDAIDDKDE